MKTLKLIFAALTFITISISCSSGESSSSQMTCAQASSKSDDARVAYDNATSSNYVTLCTAYRSALQKEISVCGDPDGDLQSIIDGLGDCGSTPAPSVTVTVGTLVKTFELNKTITVVGSTKKIKVYDNVNGNDFVYFEIQQGATGSNVINNFNIHLITSDYNPMAVDEGGNWISNITTNSSSSIIGTFSGYVTSPTTGADLSLTQGSISINL
jgi:hypothetical protein